MCDASNILPVTIEETLAALRGIVAKLYTLKAVSTAGALTLYVNAYDASFQLARRDAASLIRRLATPNGWQKKEAEGVSELLVEAAELAERGLSLVPVPRLVEGGGKGPAYEPSKVTRGFEQRERDESRALNDLWRFEQRVRHLI